MLFVLIYYKPLKSMKWIHINCREIVKITLEIDDQSDGSYTRPRRFHKAED